MRRIIIIATALLCQTLLLGQAGPYQLDWKKEALIVGIGGSTLGTGHLLREQTPVLTEAEITRLEFRSINTFDRVAVALNSNKAYNGSNHCLRASYTLPLFLLAGKSTRHDFPTIAVLYGQAMLVNSGLTLLAKSSFRRPRPFVLNEKAGLQSKQSLHARSSFFSGHTSNVAANTFFVAKVFSDYYPDSKWKPVIWGAAATLPALTGYFRVKAGKHYPTDVIVGYAVGAAVGILIPQLHKKKQDLLPDGLQIDAGIGGAALRWEF